MTSKTTRSKNVSAQLIASSVRAACTEAGGDYAVACAKFKQSNVGTSHLDALAVDTQILQMCGEIVGILAWRSGRLTISLDVEQEPELSSYTNPFDVPIWPSGKRIGDATRDEILVSLAHSEKMTEDARRRGEWLQVVSSRLRPDQSIRDLFVC